jgi:hypothetical protein
MSVCQHGPKTIGPITRMSSVGATGCSARRGKPGLGVPVCRTSTLGLSLGATACRNRAAAGGATALPGWLAGRPARHRQSGAGSAQAAQKACRSARATLLMSRPVGQKGMMR